MICTKYKEGLGIKHHIDIPAHCKMPQWVGVEHVYVWKVRVENVYE